MKKFTVTGMSCAACSGNVERAVSKVEGVTSCSVSLLTNTMTVDGTASDADIIKAVERAGYGASVQGGKKPVGKEDADDNKELKTLVRRLVWSVAFLVVLMYFSMGHHMWGWPLPSFFDGNHVAVGMVQMLLTIVIMFINRKFFISGFKGVFRGSVNMDTLVGMGSGVAFLWSVYVLFAMTGAQAAGDMQAVMNYADEFYFESAAMILTLITVGKTLETYSKGKTTNALKSLMKLAPQTATVIRGGEEVVVPVEQVVTGDVFVVRPGENIPVDGVVTEGETSVNESALTGESIPSDKTAGSNVSAGTVNLTGFIKCRSTRVGEDTTLSQIIRMVSDAASTKAPVARVADKVSAVFVPAVIGLALITLIIWLAVGETAGFALARAISVLVISCPCALGLATPVAIMVGNGVGARHGILFKTSAALENTGRTEIVVLDKTGTVTNGKPVVTDMVPCGADADTLLTYAYALERKSEHPLSKAIIQKAEEMKITAAAAEDFRALPGNGLVGSIDGKEIAAGNLAFISGKAAVSAEMKNAADAFAADGKTPLFFSYDGSLLGIIAVADTVRADSAQAIKELKEMGMHVVMLTGDNARTAAAIGRQAGVDEVIADVLPGDKENVIRRLQKFGKVAMVGDGINDAPALTRADVGIAIGAGTDVAIDAADVVLVKSNLSDVPAAIKLSRATLRNIHENLFWAFIYNVIGIPLAAGAWIPLFGWEMNPMFGAAAMSLSSVCVVANALRLNLFNIRKHRKYRRKPLPVKDGKLLAWDGGEKAAESGKTVTLNIDGMMCAHCEKAVKTALEAVEGVTEATASHEKGTAVVILDRNVPTETLAAAVEAKGYKVISGGGKMEITLKVEGMMCGHCEKHVKDALEAIDGVAEATANHRTGEVKVTLTKDVPVETLKKAIEDQDYKVL